MKIKIGTVTEEIVRMNNQVYRNADNEAERLSVELKNTNRTAAAVNSLIEQNYSGTLVFVGDDGTEETFAGYQPESVRKSYDNIGRQLSVEFVKPITGNDQIIER